MNTAHNTPSTTELVMIAALLMLWAIGAAVTHGMSTFGLAAPLIFAVIA